MPIPPNGWGAVERLIWDYSKYLMAYDHRVDIINTPNRFAIIKKVNEGNYDFVHIHYDCFADIIPKLKCKKIAITSHYPYIDQTMYHGPDGYDKTLHLILNNNNFHVFADSIKDYNAFINFKIKEPTKLHLLYNSIDSENLRFYSEGNNQAICLGKLEWRKRQNLLGKMGIVDLVGKDTGCFGTLANYKGEWTDDEKFVNLGKYSAMVLMTLGENGTPLVLKEAMLCGMSVITTKFGSSEIINAPGVTSIDETITQNPVMLEFVIKEQIEKNKSIRQDIRNWALERFDFKKNIPEYIKQIESLL
jgi:glycosyltransferase involved in cell wall biosynthesis